MKVLKERSSIAPHTWTYTVDPEEGEYEYQVVVGKAGHPTMDAGQVLCVSHGPSCAHVDAVRAHIA